MIFVVGTGRCGSSAIARNLHNLGVWMGNHVDAADDLNPDGYYEDSSAKRTNRQYIGHDIHYTDLLDLVRQWMELRDYGTGFKDPRLCHLFWEYRRIHQFVFQHEPDIILVRRDRELTISSVIRSYGLTHTEAEELVDVRSGLMDNIAKYCAVSEIDMTKPKTDEEIRKWLKTTTFRCVSLSQENQRVAYSCPD